MFECTRSAGPIGKLNDPSKILETRFVIALFAPLPAAISVSAFRDVSHRLRPCLVVVMVDTERHRSLVHCVPPMHRDLDRAGSPLARLLVHQQITGQRANRHGSGVVSASELYYLLTRSIRWHRAKATCQQHFASSPFAIH